MERAVRFAQTLLGAPANGEAGNTRSHERYRRIALTAAASIAAKGVAIGASLVSVPLTLKYIGGERYGLWMTVTAFVSMLSFADLGLGNGLLTEIAEADGRGDTDRARESISSAATILSAVALCAVLAGVLAYPHADWARLYNLKSALAVSEAGMTTVVVAATVIVGVPLGIAGRIQHGYQQGFITNLWSIGGSLLSLGALWISVRQRAGLPVLAAALMGGQTVVSLVNTAVVFLWERPQLRPRRTAVARAAMWRLLKTGSNFAALQLAGAIAFSLDNILIAHLLGPDQVSRYAIAVRLFSIPLLGISMLVNPAWPAYTEAIARGEVNWARAALKRSVRVAAALSAAAGGALVIGAPSIVSVWVGSEWIPPLWLRLGLGTWVFVASIGQAFAIFLNGARVLGIQLAGTVLVGVLGALTKYVALPRLGLACIPWLTAASYVVAALAPWAFAVPIVLKRIAASKDPTPR